jgi:signal transduction histidine kinase
MEGVMSIAAQAPSSVRFRQRFSISNPRWYYWGVAFVWIVFLVWDLSTHTGEVVNHVRDLAPWLLIVGFVNLFPLWTWRYAYFTPDDAVAVAAMLVLTPTQIGATVFIGAFDPREFKGQIAPSKAIFNRSQVAAAIYLGSLCAHRMTPTPIESPYVLLLGLLGLIVMTSVNYLMVGLGVSLEHRFTLRRAFQQMKIGSSPDFVLTVFSWAVLGVMLAVLYERAHVVGLLAFLIPTLLGRQVLARSQMFIETRRAYRSREAALAEIGTTIHEERQDERRLIAASLHDDVLQPLFKVTLMAQVVRADLASGRLLEADEDLPELLSAAEVAGDALRRVIGDLRRSAIGRGGLGPALNSLARGLQELTSVRFHSAISEVSLAPESELILYQIAREALTNAATHAKAMNVWVELRQDSDYVQLRVRDDGIGFDQLVEREGHYGIAIMRERALTADAQLFIDSMPNRGCEVSLIIQGGSQDTPPVA